MKRRDRQRHRDPAEHAPSSSRRRPGRPRTAPAAGRGRTAAAGRCRTPSRTGSCPTAAPRCRRSPSFFQIRYCGTIVTAPGSIMVASTSPNSTLRPGNLKYAKPNATIELDSATKPRRQDRDVATLLPHPVQQRQLVPDLDVVLRREGLGNELVVEHLAPRLEARREQPGERIQEQQREADQAAPTTRSGRRCCGQRRLAARRVRCRPLGRRSPVARRRPGLGSAAEELVIDISDPPS